MGEVYRARDTNLNRDVALKILPPIFAADPERLARFRREAQVLASLNHPNIASIHGFEASNGIDALVLELIEGPTLAERIALGPIPVPEAIAIASQIVDAIAVAHEQGIIHRDLKPANIKLRPDGTVKVLDFGLAKALDVSGEVELTRPAVMTQMGAIVGTAAYMSPEQTRGLPLDRRADIWAFGCVLYEMLTGRGAFASSTVSDAIASILEREPDWQALPPAAARLTPLLRRCLEKDLKRRLRDIADVTLWFDDAGASASASPAAPPSRRALWIAAAFGIVAVGAVAALVMSRNQASPANSARYELTTSAAEPFTSDPAGVNVAISPDGSRIVYTASRGGLKVLVMRRLDQLEASPIAGTEGAEEPFFSPDGRHIGFMTLDALKRVPVDGGPTVTICPADAGFRGASWGAGDIIVFAKDAGVGLLRVPAAGGVPERLVSPDRAKGEENYVQPTMLPAGQGLLYTVILRGSQTRVVARALTGGDATTVVEGGFGGRYLPSGHVVFGQGDRLMAVAFDVTTRQPKGAPVAVEHGVFNRAADGVANVASAADGTTVYIAGHDEGNLRRLVWFDHRGTRLAPAIEQTVVGARNPRLSPDGRRLALTVGGNGQGSIWIYDLSGRAQPLRLTSEGHATFPIWSPDGTQIAFLAVDNNDGRMFSIPADGSAVQPVRLTRDDVTALPLSWSADGASILFERQSNLYVLRMSDRTDSRWLSTPFSEFAGRFSPDGRLVAYASNQTGPLDVWVRPFPGPGAPVRASSDGGRDPAWSADGKELFFHNGARLLSARVVSEAAGPRIETPRIVIDGGFVHDDTDSIIRFFDVAADGRLLMIEPIDTASPASLVVVQHWDQTLRRLLPVQ